MQGRGLCESFVASIRRANPAAPMTTTRIRRVRARV